MAEPTTVKAPPKRRRILDPSAIVSVPIYSNQVNKGLQLKAPSFSEKKNTEATEEDTFWTKFNTKKKLIVELSDSDEEPELRIQEPPDTSTNSNIDQLRSPSPPPDCPVQKRSRKATLKLNEIDRRLQAVNSLLSPVSDSRRGRRGRRSPRVRNNADDVIILSPTGDDDVIITSPDPSPLGSPLRAERVIPLKVRCRADIHKIPVLPSAPLSVVVEQLSVTLGVPPPRLLLLREEAELCPDATVQALGLGIADIIECVVMTDDAAEDSDDIIKVRLQGKDRDSAQEFSVHRDAPLGSVFSQYLSGLAGGAQKKVRFHFDGSKVSPHQTPAQLDMEDGDIIEVWA